MALSIFLPCLLQGLCLRVGVKRGGGKKGGNFTSISLVSSSFPGLADIREPVFVERSGRGRESKEKKGILSPDPEKYGTFSAR